MIDLKRTVLFLSCMCLLALGTGCGNDDEDNTNEDDIVLTEADKAFLEAHPEVLNQSGAEVLWNDWWTDYNRTIGYVQDIPSEEVAGGREVCRDSLGYIVRVNFDATLDEGIPATPEEFYEMIYGSEYKEMQDAIEYKNGPYDGQLTQYYKGLTVMGGLGFDTFQYDKGKITSARLMSYPPSFFKDLDTTPAFSESVARKIAKSYYDRPAHPLNVTSSSLRFPITLTIAGVREGDQYCAHLVYMLEHNQEMLCWIVRKLYIDAKTGQVLCEFTQSRWDD